MADYNLDLERHVLAAILADAGAFADVSFLKPEDFSPLHRAIFSVLKSKIDKGETISAFLVAESLKSFSVTFDGVNPLEYLQALEMVQVKKEEVETLGKTLKKKTVIRELQSRIGNLSAELKKADDKPFNEIVGMVDKTLADIDKDYFKSQTTPLFETLIDVIEEKGNNPVEVEDMGLQGPLPSLNKIAGGILGPASYILVGSRTSGGKSAFGFFYNVYVAEKYNLPLLHLDAAEMTVEQLQTRAICCLSRGRIPLWAVRSGQWRRNPTYTSIIRDELWPRVKKIRIYYQNVGSFTPQEVVSFIRRFYYKHCDKGSHLLIHDDYQKGVETLTNNTTEWQAVGYKAMGIKSLITEDITASYWTSVQNNRAGVFTGKKLSEIQDSEAVIGLSDRLLQQATTGFLMRYKVPEELAHENNLFGNVRLQPVKERELLGKDFEKSLLPVKLADGRFVKNFYNLSMKNFYYEDKGTLRDMVIALGEGIVDIEDGIEKSKDLL